MGSNPKDGWLSLVEGTGFENRRTRKGTGGSNPSPSAFCRVAFLRANLAQIFLNCQQWRLTCQNALLAHYLSFAFSGRLSFSVAVDSSTLIVELTTVVSLAWICVRTIATAPTTSSRSPWE